MSKKMGKGTSIQFIREIAYIGKIGRRREEYCKHYLKFKQRIIDEILTEQNKFASQQGQIVSCQKGCAFCCGQLIQASLGECELIVYYLYNHEWILNAFIKAFPLWLERAQQQPVLNKIEEAQRNRLAGKMSEENMHQLGKELHSYWELQIPCPFLINNICTIYEVRPWACTSVISVSPSEWCNPVQKKEPKTYCLQMTSAVHLPFYDNNMSTNLPDRNMNETVHGILTDGLRFYSKIPGIGSLYEEFISDEEVIDFRNKKRIRRK